MTFVRRRKSTNSCIKVFKQIKKTLRGKIKISKVTLCDLQYVVLKVLPHMFEESTVQGAVSRG